MRISTMVVMSGNESQHDRSQIATAYKSQPDGDGFLLGKWVLDSRVLDGELAVEGLERIDVSESSEDDNDQGPVLSIGHEEGFLMMRHVAG